MARNLANLLAVAALSSVVGACPTNNGTNPPTNVFFYPTAAALYRPTPGQPADFLYVVNADFDLAFNGSTVVAVRLRTVRDRIRDHQGCRPDPDARGAWICSEVGTIDETFTRKLNPYGTELALATYRDRAGNPFATRLYVLVRGGNSLAWFDVGRNGNPDCGTPDELGFCAADHYVGSDPAQSDPVGQVLPQQTSSLSVDPELGWIVTTHQNLDVNAATASLLQDPMARIALGMGTNQSVRPTLRSTLPGISTGLSALALLPRSMSGDRSTWIAVSRSEAFFTVLQAYSGNAGLNDNRAFLYRAAAAPVTGLNSGSNNRAIVLDPDPDAKRAYVISRSPEALLVVDISTPAASTVIDAISLPTGPSRAVAVRLDSPPRTYVYAVSYDARWIYVVDPSEHRVVDQIATQRGPHSMVYDEVDHYLYVVDFFDSSVEVIDLNTTANGAPNPSFNHRVLTFGRPGRT